MAKIGFYDYDKAAVGSDGVIFKDPLTSLPSGGAETGAGTHTYTSAGFTGVPTAGLHFTSISGQAGLATEGTLQFLISNEAFDRLTSPPATANFVTISGGSACNLNKNLTGKHVKFVCTTSLNGKYSSTQDAYFYGAPNSRTLHDGLVECIITWDQCGVKLFVDRLKVMDVLWVDSSKRPTGTSVYLNSVSTGGGDYTYKNLLISTKKTVVRTSTHRAQTINIYGDSYAALGGYPESDATGRQLGFYYSPCAVVGAEAYTEDGLNASQFQSNINNDGGILSVCHRELNKAGIFTNRLIQWGEGGAGYTSTGGASGVDTEARVDVSLDGNYSYPTIAVLIAGYNDASIPTSAADVQTAAEGIIAALKAVNSNIKIIMTTLPYNDGSAGVGPPYDNYAPSLAECQAVNTGITSAAEDSSVTLVDMFTEFGGATNDGATNMKNDFIHPDIDGRVIYGQKIAEAIKSLSL